MSCGTVPGRRQLPLLQRRRSRQQPLRVRVPRRAQHVCRRPFFHDDRLLKHHGDFAPTHRAPRFFVQASQVALVIFAALNTAVPETRAPGGNSPISASASMVLPLPDSPTIPSDSAGASCNETSFTGRIHPAAVGKSTIRSRTSSKLL